MYTIIVLILIACIVWAVITALAAIIPYVGGVLFVLWPFIALGYTMEAGSTEWWIGGTIACISWLGFVSWIGSHFDSEKHS